MLQQLFELSGYMMAFLEVPTALDIRPDAGYQHGKLDVNMTQMISEHGCFKEYLYRFKIVGGPFCPSCTNEKETVQHVLDTSFG